MSPAVPAGLGRRGVGSRPMPPPRPGSSQRDEMKIAQRSMAGYESRQGAGSPAGTLEQGGSAVPDGTYLRGHGYPTLKRWAIVGRPCGTRRKRHRAGGRGSPPRGAPVRAASRRDERREGKGVRALTGGQHPHGRRMGRGRWHSYRCRSSCPLDQLGWFARRQTPARRQGPCSAEGNT